MPDDITRRRIQVAVNQAVPTLARRMMSPDYVNGRLTAFAAEIERIVKLDGGWDDEPTPVVDPWAAPTRESKRITVRREVKGAWTGNKSSGSRPAAPKPSKR